MISIVLNFQELNPSYHRRSYPVYGKNGMVATSNTLAAQAGLDMLKKGGNAVDAALAAAACLTVCEPTSNGIGGDAFAIVAYQGKLYGLNASGPAPKGISARRIRKGGCGKIPRYGFVPVTVPGAPRGWAALAKRFGKLSLKEVFAPAIDYAQGGFPVSPLLSRFWGRAYDLYRNDLRGGEYQAWFATFAPEGRAPGGGEIFRLPDHARTLNIIAETDGEDFYRGELAQRIDRYSREFGGYLRGEDLEEYQPEWVEPISSDYRGYQIWELPPNGQGIVALMALNILSGFEFPEKESALTYHRQIEAVKLAFETAQRYVTDPREMKIGVEELLSSAWADERRRRISQRASLPFPSKEGAGGTVYLGTADSAGNMVSFIQSNYMGFGSGLVVPGTGIALHNRGHNFSLDPEHHNCLKPGKRPYHTIIPGFLSKGDRFLGPFGVMGGFMQPQGHVQVLMNLIDFGHDPQAALEAPRLRWKWGKAVDLENSFSPQAINSLVELGHEVTVTKDNAGYGRGQLIFKMENGLYIGASESRVDGAVVAW